jgi:GDP-mannose transporter
MSNKKDEDIEMRGLSDKRLGNGKSFVPRPAVHHWATMGDNKGGVLSRLESNPGAAVLAYCFSSISMTVVNKYVVSGSSWNLNFLYLAIQVFSAQT